ncbi:MAG: hypothetical protein WBE47_00455 [Candidatus Acidiferrales bacterium]
MSFEVFTREFVRTTDPKVAITNLGRFSINNSATALLRGSAGMGAGSELRVLLLWDKSTNQIGIQPIKKPDSRSYPLKAYGPKGRSGTGFSAVTFLRFINYDLSTGTHSYPAKLDGEMLVLTVPKERISGLPMMPEIAAVKEKTKRIRI